MTSKVGAYSYKLLLQDCLKGMQEISSNNIDIVVTSPPYNLGIAYGHYKDSCDRFQYLNWCKKWTRDHKFCDAYNDCILESFAVTACNASGCQ